MSPDEPTTPSEDEVPAEAEAEAAATPEAEAPAEAKPRRRRRAAKADQAVPEAEDAVEEPAAEEPSEPDADEPDTPQGGAGEIEPTAEDEEAEELAESEEDTDEGEDGEIAAEADEAEERPRRARRARSEPAPTPAPSRRGRRAPRRTTVRAQAKYVRTSARKARMVCVQLRGKSVAEARAILAFTPRDVARGWSKLLESAVANAENNHELVGDDLIVREAYADEGPTIKRFRPRALGRATSIHKRTSHLTITLTLKP